MEVIQQLCATALEHHHAGRLHAAEQIYRQILEANPDHPDALHLLGVIAHQTGEHVIAVKFIQRAIRQNGTDASYFNNLGNALAAQRKLDDAITAFRRALDLNSDNAGTRLNLGIALMERGDLDDAITSFRESLALNPANAEAHYRQGLLLHARGQTADAVDHFRKSLSITPGSARVENDLGNCYRDQGRIDEAIACYQRAVTIQPNLADAFNNLGIVLADRGQFEDAVPYYRRALHLNPGLAESYYNLGNSLNSLGKVEDALECFRKAVELQPDRLPMLDQLIRCRQQLCLWDDLGPLMERAVGTVCSDAPHTIDSAMPPFAFLAMSTVTTSKQQYQCASRWVSTILKPSSQSAVLKVPAEPFSTNSKIRLGYLSADFRSHPVADLIVELLELHDRERFSVTAYSYGPDDGSASRKRILDAVDTFVEMKDFSFEDSARRIADDRIDILIDLTGFTQHARAQILAMRPAPIQVSYLGFTGTMGASLVDYILVDDFVVPSDRQPYYAEKIVHLPGCYQVSDGQRTISSATPARSEFGLPEEGFVFCSFNQHYKITPQIFDVWMELLREIPSSVLWLPEGNAISTQSLRNEAIKRGVSEERLIFAPRLPNHSDHLARYRAADLFLDTFPFNAHTTANDALWAGCPVLTLSGETFVSRVAGSLLRCLGVPELVASNHQEYLDLALCLARDRTRLHDLRSRLETNRHTSPLFDTRRFARNIENAFVTMQALRVQGKTPRPFEVSG